MQILPHLAIYSPSTFNDSLTSSSVSCSAKGLNVEEPSLLDLQSWCFLF